MDRLAKTIKIIGIIFGILFGTFFISYHVLRIFGYVNSYRCASQNMYPNIQLNAFIFTSSSVKPERGKIFFYKKQLQYDEKKQTYIGRIAAIAGDTCQLKNGYLYINGIIMDKEYKIAFPYFKEFDSTYSISDLQKSIESQTANVGFYDEKFYIVYLEKENVNELRNATNAVDSSYDRFTLYQNDSLKFTYGNYGPIIIPKGKYFILGDNRYNSYDSRFWGFADEQDMKEGVLFILN